MNQTRRNPAAWAGLWAGVLLIALTPAVLAQAPHTGDVQKREVLTLSMQVGSTEKETRQVTYTPPPGWYIRSHVVHCTAKRGNSSFSVTTVPQDWNWLSEEKVRESWKVLIDLAAKAHAPDLQAKFTMEQEILLQGIRRVRATHHALVVDATARGEGFLRSGGCIELTITAELVYLGTEESIRRTSTQHRARLK
jgi:hypothetical protein